MITTIATKLFTRDLNALKLEVNSYKNEDNLWVVSDAISNSAGNLCVHLIGNLNHYIGAILGGTGYVRQRDLEFSVNNILKSDLMQKINETITVVENTLSNLTKEDLHKEYKRRVFEDTMTTEYFLVHLTVHLGYHLGQINYHRRFFDL